MRQGRAGKVGQGEVGQQGEVVQSVSKARQWWKSCAYLNVEEKLCKLCIVEGQARWRCDCLFRSGALAVGQRRVVLLASELQQPHVAVVPRRREAKGVVSLCRVQVMCADPAA